MKMCNKWIIGMLSLTATILHADTFYVSREGAHKTPFNSRENASTNIQSAVDIAQEDDTILVRAGKYKGTGDNVVLINRSLTLKSDSGNPADVIIDCEGVRRGILAVLTNAESVVTIGGITVTNGYTAAKHGHGAGIYLNHTALNAGTAEIRNCVIAGNFNVSPNGHNRGGGLASIGKAGSVFHTVVSGCTISGNTVTNRDSRGGGAAFKNTCLTLEDCKIEKNRSTGNEKRSGFGGGIHVDNVPTGSVIC
ncbi:hypothetical protein ACFLQL_03905, partial [Verrucomicrobiota bacterium]